MLAPVGPVIMLWSDMKAVRNTIEAGGYGAMLGSFVGMEAAGVYFIILNLFLGGDDEHVPASIQLSQISRPPSLSELTKEACRNLNDRAGAVDGAGEQEYGCVVHTIV